MAKYYINHHTGAGNEYIDGTLADAMQAADAGASYTQEPITIHDDTGAEVARRQWWGVKYDPDEDDAPEDDIIGYGDYGYYGAWQA